MKSGSGRSLAEWAARLLDRDERDAVLGDLSESGESSGRALLDILGLVIRRHAALWNDWRPWFAALIVALPATLLLIGVSFYVSCTYQRLVHPMAFDERALTGHQGFLLLCQTMLLLLWSWACGFVVGSASRRTLWASVASSLSVCSFCLARFGEAPVPALCLLLFLPPAILGARQSLRIPQIRSVPAFTLATVVTVLMISLWSNGSLWTPNWALLGPAWCVAIMARQPRAVFRAR